MLTRILKFLLLIIPVLVCVAFITLAERKVLRLIGIRQGPNKVSAQGIMQPIADAIKLANKGTNYLSNFSLLTYYLSVIIILFCSLILWSRVKIIETSVRWKFSFLVMMLILGVACIKTIIAGWRTYGKYPLIGRMRTVSLIISYESVIYLCILFVVWISKRFRITEISQQEIYAIYLIFPLILFFWTPSIMAELNRTPYDFSEGERELVRGFNTEFGSGSFTIIFLREYSNIILFIMISCFIFFSSSRTVKFIIFFIFFNYWIIWMRRTLPHIRFDKFMNRAWKFYIPRMTIIVLTIFIKI